MPHATLVPSPALKGHISPFWATPVFVPLVSILILILVLILDPRTGDYDYEVEAEDSGFRISDFGSQGGALLPSPGDPTLEPPWPHRMSLTPGRRKRNVDEN